MPDVDNPILTGAQYWTIRPWFFTVPGQANGSPVLTGQHVLLHHYGGDDYTSEGSVWQSSSTGFPTGPGVGAWMGSVGHPIARDLYSYWLPGTWIENGQVHWGGQAAEYMSVLVPDAEVRQFFGK